jgi:hypothetical protein
MSQSVAGATAGGFIESYLKGMDPVSYAGSISLLGALMRDAEAAVTNHALWLGAVAYLMPSSKWARRSWPGLRYLTRKTCYFRRPPTGYPSRVRCTCPSATARRSRPRQRAMR